MYCCKLITYSKFKIESPANILYRLPWVISFFISLLIDWFFLSPKRYLEELGWQNSMYGFPSDFKENFGKIRKSFCMQPKCYRESIGGKIVSSAPPEVGHVLRKNRKTRKRRPAVCWTPTRISSRIGIWLMGCLNRNSWIVTYIGWGEVERIWGTLSWGGPGIGSVWVVNGMGGIVFMEVLMCILR